MANKPIVQEDKDKIIKIYTNPAKRPVIVIEQRKQNG
jgi:hypothetical protein